jgi:hypothetical protein
MAIHAAAHSGHVGCYGHNIHLIYLAMARLAFQSGFRMSAMTPIHKSWNSVNSRPGNRLMFLIVLSEFPDRGFVFRNARVACHTLCGVWEGNLIARVRILMTKAASKLGGGMGFVTERNGLNRRS